MKAFVQCLLEEGGSILVEVDMPESEGMLIKVVSSRDLTVKATASFENAVGSIKSLANAVVSKLQNLNYPPDEIGAMFGMSFKADGTPFSPE
ncbi:MAG: hypothetical protein E4G89_00695 [Methanothrix sp.]|nr:MAG: hypothetical protein E4G89_00695 [Methanothrix sp.]